MAQAITCAIAPVLTVIDGKATTTSVDVARHFGKQHGHVLRDIENLRAQLPAQALSNFGEGSYTKEETGEQRHRMFIITRDGFTLLAMGFTGKRALAFKLAYIDAFNKMEAALLAPPTTITPSQQQHLKELVDLVVESGKQKSHAETWARLHRKFGVPRYTELPAAQFDAACQYLLGKLDAPSIIAIIQKHLPAQRAHDAHRAAAEASKHIYSAVFDAVMNGDEHYARHRYLLKFAHDSQINPNLPIVVTMDDAAFIGTWDGITREVSKHGKWWSDTDLSAMIHACATQLASRNPGQRQPPALACG